MGQVKGRVTDEAGHPVPVAQVSLETPAGTPSNAQATDSKGNYGFQGLAEGSYKIKVRAQGFRDESSDLFTLHPEDTKKVDFTLHSTGSGGGASSRPEFFDQPQFTVAGVIDTTSLGSHGTDTVVRTTESLVRDTASLGEISKGGPANTPAESEETLRARLKGSPDSFDANHQLGQMLSAMGRSREALPYLTHAASLNADDLQNNYVLAATYYDLGDYEHASSQLRALLLREQLPDAVHLMGAVEEKLGNPLAAVQQYQKAAELAPTERNLFDWGSELLLHRALEPAGDVFTQGGRLFPTSSRMLVGLGVTLYARGAYDQAVQRLCAASDLDPASAAPYLFLGQIQTIDSARSADVTTRLARFARLQPENANANFYYAMSLSKARRGPEDTATLDQIEMLLRKAVELDPHHAKAFLQLGILKEERGRTTQALALYQQAAAADPHLEQAHYRLAQAYRKAGDAQKAGEELALYESTSKQSVEQAEREQREIRGFVYTLRGQPAAGEKAAPAQ